MLNSKPLSKLIFLDIETVPQTKLFTDMPESKQKLFLKRFRKDSEEMIGAPMDAWDSRAVDTGHYYPADKIEAFYNARASLHAEFCKIVCISIGFFTDAPDTLKDLKDLKPEKALNFRTKSFYGADELDLLNRYYAASKSVLDLSSDHKFHMVAFNGKVFDFPVIAKRMLLNWMALPPYFDVSELKPWEMGHLIDPKENWKWGVFDGNASLPMLCECFGIPSSKDDISGDQVRHVFYEENDVKRIAVYCEKDVKALAELYLRLKGIRNEVVMEVK